MSLRRFLVGVLFAGVISLIVSAPVLAAGPVAEKRTWTNRRGQSINKAEFVRIVRGVVVLKQFKKIVKIAFSQLSDDDQEYLRRELKARGQEKLIPPTNKTKVESRPAEPVGPGAPAGVPPEGPGAPTGFPPGAGPMAPSGPPPGGLNPGAVPPGVPPAGAGSGALSPAGVPDGGFAPPDPRDLGPSIPPGAGAPSAPGPPPGAGAPSGPSFPPSGPGGFDPGSSNFPPGAGPGGIGAPGPSGEFGGSRFGPSNLGSPPVPSSPIPPGAGSGDGSGFGGATAEQKACSGCGKIVSANSAAGQKCPHCGVYWSFEEDQYGRKANSVPRRWAWGGGAGAFIAICVVIAIRLFARR